jgi:hypothetical protein
MGEVTIIHVNDELDTKTETILQDGEEFYWLLFHNVSTVTQYLSFDGGSNWKQVAADKTLELTAPPNMKIHLSEPLKAKAAASGAKFEMLIMKDR